MASAMMQKSVVGSGLASSSLSRRATSGARRSLVIVAAATKTKASAMVCIDCGYIYDEAKAFDSLPGSYKCPVCSASKKRFKAYSGNAAKKNDPKTMQTRRAALRNQVEESGEEVEEDAGYLYITGGVTLALLGAFTYFVLNR